MCTRLEAGPGAGRWATSGVSRGVEGGGGMGAEGHSLSWRMVI